MFLLHIQNASTQVPTESGGSQEYIPVSGTSGNLYSSTRTKNGKIHQNTLPRTDFMNERGK